MVCSSKIHWSTDTKLPRQKHSFFTLCKPKVRGRDSPYSGSFFKKHVSTLTPAKADHLLEIMVVNIKILCFMGINRYQRKYFLSFDQKFRVTLDNHLKYYPVSSPEQLSSCGLKDSLSMIMELKYSPIYQLESNNITQEFPFRVIKNSKYVRGIQIIYNLGTHI